MTIETAIFSKKSVSKEQFEKLVKDSMKRDLEIGARLMPANFQYDEAGHRENVIKVLSYDYKIKETI